MMSNSKAVIVVPCYNEAKRLALESFASFVRDEKAIHFIFVNDGSTDDTLDALNRLRDKAPDRFSVVNQFPNLGKAAAVHEGMKVAFRSGAPYAGYWDADLATPLEEIPRFIAFLDRENKYDFVLGSRVRLLGRNIDRRAFRHYLGRVFATAASLTLRLPVYDTQCGAKLFRTSQDMRIVFEKPFLTHWIFDVEILARLIALRRTRDAVHAVDTVYELPLASWRDVGKSKVKPLDFIKAVTELYRIHSTYMRSH
jgi:dolichyl-phosphate beta-glucosyltransferase